jgi:hypothetical protein
MGARAWGAPTSGKARCPAARTTPQLACDHSASVHATVAANQACPAWLMRWPARRTAARAAGAARACARPPRATHPPAAPATHNNFVNPPVSARQRRRRARAKLDTSMQCIPASTFGALATCAHTMACITLLVTGPRGARTCTGWAFINRDQVLAGAWVAASQGNARGRRRTAASAAAPRRARARSSGARGSR